MKKQFALICYIFALLIVGLFYCERVSATGESVFRVQTRFTYRNNDTVYTAYGKHYLPADSVITRVSIRINNPPAETVYDVGGLIVTKRDDPAKYIVSTAGYQESLLFMVHRMGSNANYSYDLDLSATPLFYPKDTELLCNSAGTGLTATTGNQTELICEITYRPYRPGEKIYRVFRLPYIDEGQNPGQDQRASYYFSSSIFPIKVKSAYLFLNFNGSTTPCLKWFHQGGDVQQSCWGQQNRTPDYDSSSVGPLNVDWSLPVGDKLSSTCLLSGGGDCVIYAIVEIPSNLRVTAENSFRDYNNVNVTSDYLPQYCTQWASTALSFNPYFCNGASSCPQETMVDNCMRLFPQASCLLTNSCLTSQTPIIPGDLDQSGKVDILDLRQLLTNFTNIFDYNSLMKNYGATSFQE